ncbi:MAG: DUF1559 domain-containing protein, partial [Planctomycetales bacterium]
MLTCPICDAEIDENTRVCPACRSNLAGGGAPRGAPSRHGPVLAGILIAIVLLGVVVALLLPAVSSPRAARRSESKSNLRQLAIAVHNYHDEYGSLPVAQQQIDAGAALHGWQTYLLPFLDEKALYGIIDFDRPWNGPANAPPFHAEIGTFLSPGIGDTHDPRGYPLLHYAGNSRVLGRVPALSFSDIDDGLMNTILFGEVKEGLRAWGDPRNLRDPALGLNRGPATFGSNWKSGGVQFAAADRSIHYIASDAAPHVLKALATPDGGE